jgi:hypothetical protein
MLARAVDVRRHLGVHPGYQGLLQTMTYNKDMIQTVSEEPLEWLLHSFDPSSTRVLMI